MSVHIRLTIVCLFMLSLTHLSGPAGAGERPVELGVDMGFAGMDSKYRHDGGRVNLRVGRRLTDLFQLEAQAGSSVTECSGADCTHVFTWFLNGVFNFRSAGRRSPYVLAGAGYATREAVTFTDPGGTVFFGSEGSGAAQLAGGIRFFFGEKRRSALRLEVSGFVEDTFDESATHLNATVGFAGYFGKQR